MSLGQRIRARREEIGLSQSELARRAGVSQPVINVLERGGATTSRYLATIARALAVDVADLDPRFASAAAASPTVSIEIVGLVGAGAGVDWEDDERGNLSPARAPRFDHALAFRVVGESMLPRFRPGEVLLFSREPQTLDRLADQVAMVQLVDGRRMIKIIRRSGQADRWTLESHNAEPMTGQEVLAAWRYLGSFVETAGKEPPALARPSSPRRR